MSKDFSTIMEGHVTELLPGFALDSLDEQENLYVIQHLAGCASCRAELRAYQTVADQLGMAAPVIEPPPELRQKVMLITQPAAPTAQSSRSSLADIFRSLFTTWRLAGVLLVLALVASNLLLWQRVQQMSAATSIQIFQTVALKGTNVDPQAYGMLVVSSDGQYGTLVVENLPQQDNAHQYQLWLIKDGQRTSGGVFSVTDDGYASLSVASPQALKTYSSFGITVEPFGGSPQPSGVKVLGGSY